METIRAQFLQALIKTIRTAREVLSKVVRIAFFLVNLRQKLTTMRKTKLAARDQALFDRFIYWSEIKRLRFDDVIRILSEEEFFISEQLVLRIVRRLMAEGRTSSDGVSASRPKFKGFRLPEQDD